MDNASNNNTLIAAISDRVSSVTSKHCLRCAGHINNLIVKAILYGEGITEFNKRIIGCSDSKSFELWRKFGALGKVHNTAKYIVRSDQRSQELLELQGSERTYDGDDNELFDETSMLLTKDGGIR